MGSFASKEFSRCSRLEVIHMLGVIAAYMSPYSEDARIKPKDSKLAVSDDDIYVGIYELATFDPVLQEMDKAAFLHFIKEGPHSCYELSMILAQLFSAEDDVSTYNAVVGSREEIVKAADTVLANYREVFPDFQAVRWWHKSSVCRALSPYTYFAGGTKRQTMWLKTLDGEDTTLLEPLYRAALWLYINEADYRGVPVETRVNELKQMCPVLEQLFGNQSAILMFSRYDIRDDIVGLAASLQTDIPEVMYRACRLAYTWQFRNRNDAYMGMNRMLSLL